ncbi:MAG: NADH-quinone oxidoreductase subunit C [Candidatus Cloacimonadaceae bacterium]
MKDLFDKLSLQFTLSEFMQQRPNLAFVTVEKPQLVSLITCLRDTYHYTHLVFVTAVDWLENKQFQLTYMLHNYNTHTDFGIRVRLDRDNPVMASIHLLWEQGRVYQRELHEMFGIAFPGSPGVEEPMILEGWQGPPVMRRDFDTKKYSLETYDHRRRDTKEPETYMKEKLYPED